MTKVKVFFDTCVILKTYKRDFIDRFPSETNCYFVFDEVLEELFLLEQIPLESGSTGIGSIGDGDRLSFLKRYNFEPLPSTFDLLFSEINKSPLTLTGSSEEIYNYLSQKSFHEEASKYRLDRIKSNMEVYKNIKDSSLRKIEIFSAKLHARLREEIEKESFSYQEIFPFPSSVAKLNAINRLENLLEIKGKKIFLSNIRSGEKKFCSEFKDGDDLEQNYPSLFLCMLFQLFQEELKRPRGTSKEAKNFKVFLNEEEIKIEPNFFSDTRIGLLYLPLMDKFVTSDKSCSKFLQNIAPTYSDKVMYLNLTS